MKVRSVPPITTVRSILEERIGEARKLLDEDNTELAKLTESAQQIYNPYYDNKVRDTKSAIVRRTEYIRDREMELKLLTDHEAPRIMVEFDI